MIAKAVEAKVVKAAKVRADTTVVSANVKYPTDSGLLARAVIKIGKLGPADQDSGWGSPAPHFGTGPARPVHGFGPANRRQLLCSVFRSK